MSHAHRSSSASPSPDSSASSCPRLFLKGGAGGAEALGFVEILQNAAVAPVVAFFTFIAMDNVPLAAMLWARDVSFGGVMAFLAADLVAATVVWVHYKYYGWRYTLYLFALLYLCMAAAGVTVHYLFRRLRRGSRSEAGAAGDGSVRRRSHPRSERDFLGRCGCSDLDRGSPRRCGRGRAGSRLGKIRARSGGRGQLCKT